VIELFVDFIQDMAIERLRAKDRDFHNLSPEKDARGRRKCQHRQDVAAHTTSLHCFLSNPEIQKTDPFACDTNPDPDDGVDKARGSLMPGILRVYRRNHHHDNPSLFRL